MQHLRLPTMGARLRVLSGPHAGEVVTVLHVRESFPGDPVVTVQAQNGMPTYWRPAWGVRGMPMTEALPSVAH